MNLKPATVVKLINLRLLSCLCLLLMTATAAGAVEYQPGEPIPGRYIVKLSKGTTVGSVQNALGAGVEIRPLSALPPTAIASGGDLLNRLAVVHDRTRALTAASISRSLGNHRIEYIEQDHWIEFFDIPADSLFSHQWYLRNTGQDYYGIERIDGANNDRLVMKTGLAGADINIFPLYQNPPADRTRVVVAIVDSGVDLKHPELEGRFWRNLNEIPGNNIDDDHNGYVDDTLGWDPSGDVLTLFDPVGDNDPTDSVGHGTHIAGIVAANADGAGVVGIAPWVQIMPVKVRPNANLSVSAEGMLYAIASGADVINVSWGTLFESGILREVFALARANGVFVAIAAGNTGSNDRFFPAAYDSSFAVGASNALGEVTNFSTTGAHIDIVAPGRDILSLRAAGTDMYAPGEPSLRMIGDDSLYYLSDGTSMAAPMVAGTAALLLGYRPDLSLVEIEHYLTLGADDLIDPYKEGDNLPGKDSISGHGVLNLHQSWQLIAQGGVALVEPLAGQRFIDSIVVSLQAFGDYGGDYTLEYADGFIGDDWTEVTAGNIPTNGTVQQVVRLPNVAGPVSLRVVDAFGKDDRIHVTLVHNNVFALDSPAEGEELQYNIPISGSAYGPGYDSMAIRLRYPSGSISTVYSTTGELFDSLITTASVSGTDTGQFQIFFDGWFDGTKRSDTVGIAVISAFAEGWPRPIGGRAGITPTSVDLDNDGIKELVVTSQAGLFVFTPTGESKPGFPVMTNTNMTCVPAVYDVDRDGNLEIICTNETGLHVFKHDGTYASGFPVEAPTGRISFGYGFPNPTVTRLAPDEDSAIVFVNVDGQVMAYEFNGDSYFYSLDGLFSSFNPRLSISRQRGGDNSPFVTVDDLNGDGAREVIATYTSPPPYSGLGYFDARSGQPAFGMSEPVAQEMRSTHGAVLTDLNHDGLNEVIAAGYDSALTRHIWIKTMGTEDYPGWPRALPEVSGWLAQVPVVADLDLDGTPEILSSHFGLDIGILYILRADGTPYVRDNPIAFTAPNTFGNLTVANLTGDAYPEIAFRGGKILPGVGKEKVFILDHEARPLPGWPIETPARKSQVLSSRMAPLIDDIDSDGLVEMVLTSDNATVLVWDFDASYEDGKNMGRFLGNHRNTNIIQPSDVPTDIGDDPTALLPAAVTLSQNYPNPFNPVTTIEYSLPERARVTLDVFNILGQRVDVLVNGEQEAGNHRITFDGSRIASGVYFYRLTVADNVQVKKMVLVK